MSYQLDYSNSHTGRLEMERENCDSYVEKRMIQQQMTKITQDVTERENLDDRIEVKRRFEPNQAHFSLEKHS